MNIEKHFDGNIYWTFSILNSAILCQDNTKVFCCLILFLINVLINVLIDFLMNWHRLNLWAIFFEKGYIKSNGIRKKNLISNIVKKYLILKTLSGRHWLNILNILKTHFLWNIRQYCFIFCQDKAMLAAKKSCWNYFKLILAMR